jgi:hypothetical protein
MLLKAYDPYQFSCFFGRRKWLNDQIKRLRKEIHLLSLRIELGGLKKKTDSRIANKVRQIKELQRKILEMQIPSLDDAKDALTLASNEIKYVFGVLGFAPKIFVILVGKLGLFSLDRLMNNYHNLEALCEHQDFPDNTYDILQRFADWYDVFQIVHNRKPIVIRKDFNETVWESVQIVWNMSLLKPRRIQPSRFCKKEPLFFRWGKKDEYISYCYLLYNELNMYLVAREEVESRLITNAIHG